MTNVLVTGATGTVGRHLLDALLAAGQRPTALVQSPQRAAGLPAGAQAVVGGFADPDSLDRAMTGVERVFLLCPNVPAQVDHETAVIDAAVRAGVHRIVKLSAHGADEHAPVAFWQWHAAVEAHLRSVDVPFVALRPTFSMANILGHADQVSAQHVVFAPSVSAPIAMVDPRDVADVAAHLLTAPELDTDEVLELSGPDAVTFDDMASCITTLTGWPVSYRPGTAEEVTAYLAATGVPMFVTNQILAIFQSLQSGAQAVPVSTVQDLLGRPAGTLRGFLAQHVAAFRAAS
jgi:uncharacterized protein YbjT (DUF2867 family)